MHKESTSKVTPGYGQIPSTVVPGGTTTGNTPFHKDKHNVGANLNILAGVNQTLERIEPVKTIDGGIETYESGFYADMVTLLYYVRDADYSLMQGTNNLYVADSLGRHKKIVVFRNGAGPDDLAQVTVMYYQIAAFPTKITSIKTYYDKVGYYLDSGTGEPFYDLNSAAQQNIAPNP